MPHRRLAELYGEHDLPVHRTTLLALMFAAGSVLCVMAAFLSRAPLVRQDVLLGSAVVGSVVAVALWVRRKRRPRLWVLQAALMLFSVMIAVVAAHSSTVNDVTSLGPAVIMTCAYAGCFYIRRALWTLLTVSVGSYLVGAVLSSPHIAWTSVVTACCVAVGLGVVLHQLTSVLRRRSQLDPLTGAVSRAMWMKIAEEAMLSRGRNPLTIAMLDLDNFKQINDSLGHRAGDELLHGLAESWKAALAGEGLLGRYGGDEFVILFVDTGRRSAQQLLERVRSAHPAAWTSGADQAAAADDLPSLLDRVDQQLRLRKSSRTIPAQPGPSRALAHGFDSERLRSDRDLSHRS